MKSRTRLKMFWAICAFSTLQTISAQSIKQQDREAIKAMCGCYEISFKYTETFSPQQDYEKKEDYTASALEWAQLIQDEENQLSIQHLLIVRDTMVIKHWRQDWLYESTKTFNYRQDNQWNFESKSPEEVKGQWTQRVYQVDDSPRYAGSATWIHADGKHYWENKASSPLPRREFSKRSDYNVMIRGNRHELMEAGWVHEQDNDKVIRTEGKEDVLLAQEKGFNTYARVEDSRCQAAQDWWKSNEAFWANVRAEWSRIYDRKEPLQLKKRVEEKPLFMHLYPLEKEKAGRRKIRKVLEKFVVNPSASAKTIGK